MVPSGRSCKRIYLLQQEGPFQGTLPGDPLDNEQAFAVKCALKEAKEAETPGQLSIGVKAKIAGGIVANLSDMPPGAEKIVDALTAIDSLQF